MLLFRRGELGAADGDAGLIAQGAGKERQRPGFIGHGFHVRGRQGLQSCHGILLAIALHIGEGDQVAGLERGEGTKVGAVVVGGDDQMCAVG